MDSPRFVSPPANQIDQLEKPFNEATKLVFEFFDNHLVREWEIYIHPHLNGLRPDFVLLNPKLGIAVFEVKDWDLNSAEYSLEEITDKNWILNVENENGENHLRIENPVQQIHKYKEEIYEIYCPRLAQNAGFAVITAGIICPFSEEEKVNNLLNPCLEKFGMLKFPKYNPISGKESIHSGDIPSVFPESARPNSFLMEEKLAKDMRNWLVEPDFASTQRQPLEFLDKEQLYLTKTRTASGYRRIKGPAGSGKSLILGARAAKLIGEGKNVLVVTFNITLLHYLMDITVRCPESLGKTREKITWLNFHMWCKRTAWEAEDEHNYKALWYDVKAYEEQISELRKHQEMPQLIKEKEIKRLKEIIQKELTQILEIKIPNYITSLIEQDDEFDEVDQLINRYDAILVDEGQDFLPSWWNLLRKICRPNGEMMLVADTTQDIYEKAKSWTDESMKNAGFLGGWNELKYSYRLPGKALEYAKAFALKFLPSDTRNLPGPPQGKLWGHYPCKLKWVQIMPEKALDTCLNEIILLAPSADPKLLSMADIIFLAESQEFGHEVVEKLKEKGINTIDTFDIDSKESQRKKMGFYMGDARIKATTLHSFKGWESRAIVIFIGKAFNNKSLSLVYTGLTRLKWHAESSFMTVVSSAEELAEYGKTWPEYSE